MLQAYARRESGIRALPSGVRHAHHQLTLLGTWLADATAVRQMHSPARIGPAAHPTGSYRWHPAHRGVELSSLVGTASGAASRPPRGSARADRRLRSPVRSARAQQEEVVSAARASGADHSTRHRSAAKGVRAHTRTEPRGPRRRASSRTTLCHSVRSLNIRIRSRASAGRKTEAGRSGVRIRGREVRETASAS